MTLRERLDPRRHLPFLRHEPRLRTITCPVCGTTGARYG